LFFEQAVTKNTLEAKESRNKLQGRKNGTKRAIAVPVLHILDTQKFFSDTHRKPS
jgi:hypothetical protein